MTSEDQSARDALRLRQGAGARFDAANAPHAHLLLARRGTGYFARKLNELGDADLAAPSLRAGWTRQHLVAHVSHQARALAIALKALHAPLIADEADWRPDLALAATLPTRALRHLFEHTAKHLDVEWRDLPEPCWDRQLTTPEHGVMPARETPNLRAKEIWRAAIDLGCGGRWTDIPDDLR